MGLLELMKRDANDITTNLVDFAEDVTFIAPTGQQATVQSLHTKHHLGFNIETAQEINTLKAHVCVSEQELTALSYPVRNSKNEVTFKDHKVRAKDANGLEWTYAVQEWFPNDKVGVISVILGSFKQ